MTAAIAAALVAVVGLFLPVAAHILGAVPRDPAPGLGRALADAPEPVARALRAERHADLGLPDSADDRTGTGD